MDTPAAFGPFVLLEKIAEGGMAVTWLARVRDDEPGAELVVKRILPRLSEDAELRALFLDEARVALRLNHPNVVRTFGFGDVDGEYWLAMEHIWGQDLRRTMERAQAVGKQLPVRLAVDLIARAARGLHHAHDLLDERGRPAGLVHRDISPPNVMLGFDGNVKLVDFGIARAEGHWLQARPGQLKGKFSYMSPEQVQGLEIDHRSDIFSLGILLYELTTRTRLFKADSDVQTIKLVSDAAVDPPQRLRADFPPRLSEILMRALAADPANRYATAAELADALELFLKETRQEVAPTALAAFLREIFPDRIEDLNTLVGREYTGATRAPTLPAPPPVAPATAPKPTEDAPSKQRPSGSVVRVTHEVAPGEDDDPFLRQQRGGRAILAVFAIVAIAVFAWVGWIALGRGISTSYMDQVDIGIAREDFDAELPPPPEAPPTTTVSITSEPPGAWIVVNGIAARTQTPATVPLVIGAVNSVALHLDGHETLYHTVDDVAADAAPLALPLVALTQPADWTPPAPAAGEPPPTEPVVWTPPIGRVRIETRSPAGALDGAEVLRNGERLEGTTPLTVDVPAGQDQHFTVRLAGYRDAVTVVRAIPWTGEADTRVVTLEMPAARENAAQMTTLRLTTTPRDARVSIDGEDLGTVNLRNLQSPLHYVVRIEAPDHEPFVRAIDARPGQIVLNALLTPIRRGPAALSIRAEPDGVQIFGQSLRHGAAGPSQIGTTTVERRTVEAGPYQITLFHAGPEGRQRARTDVELAPDTHTTLQLRMEAGEVVVVNTETEPLAAE
jgi:serine/threonine protein kinase